jgi:hypothetical protein
MLLFMPPHCRCHSDMYDDIRLHYSPAVTSQLFWLAPLSDEILDVVTSKEGSYCYLSMPLLDSDKPHLSKGLQEVTGYSSRNEMQLTTGWDASVHHTI